MKYFSDRSPFGRCGRKGRVTELGCVRGPLDTGGGWVARGGSGFERHAPFLFFVPSAETGTGQRTARRFKVWGFELADVRRLSSVVCRLAGGQRALSSAI